MPGSAEKLPVVAVIDSDQKFMRYINAENLPNS